MLTFTLISVLAVALAKQCADRSQYYDPFVYMCYTCSNVCKTYGSPRDCWRFCGEYCELLLTLPEDPVLRNDYFQCYNSRPQIPSRTADPPHSRSSAQPETPSMFQSSRIDEAIDHTPRPTPDSTTDRVRIVGVYQSLPCMTRGSNRLFDYLLALFILLVCATGTLAVVQGLFIHKLRKQLHAANQDAEDPRATTRRLSVQESLTAGENCNGDASV